LSLALLIAGLLCFSHFAPAPAQAQGYYSPPNGQPIQDIAVVGAERIEPSTILTYLDVNRGDSMTTETFDRALKSLFGTGLFADVTLRQKGGTLEVTVVENPVINEIAFEGNDKMKDEELLAEIQLRPRQVFTRTKVQADSTRLYQLYQRGGRFSVNIEPKIIELDQNRVNLVFEIDEGDVTEVRSIRFVGNEKFDDDKLRSEISSRENEWYRFLSTADRYDPDRLGFDQELLRRFYLSQGYADFRIVSANAELSPERDSFYLTFTVEEGERYKVGDVAINSELKNFDADVLKPHVTFGPDDWYNAEEVKISVDKITAALGDMQYAFVNIRPDVKRNREAQTVDIAINISEAPRVFVERIDVHGNVRTMDKVVRREMLLEEGDPYNRTKLARSEQEVKDLNYFETVTVTPKPGSAPDKTVIDIEVAEQSTGELSVGAGFSTSDGPLADFRITERNLMGKGQTLSLGATVAGERSEFSTSFTEPYFMGRDFSAGIDAFHVTRDLQDESSFNQRRTGGGLRFGYPLSEKWRQVIRYRIENNEIMDVQQGASRYVVDQAGKRLTSAISQTLTYDSRDSSLIPTNGLFGWLETEYAGIGGDANYVSGKLGASYFYPIADNWVFNILGEGGAITGVGGETVRINERYYLGGSTLRGFASSGVGPRDLNTDDSLGGNLFYRGSLELTMPTPLPEDFGIKAHTFTDVGSLWDLDEPAAVGLVDEHTVRASAGVGISWRSPMGPVRADVSFPYAKEDYDEEEMFRFSFGTRF
jgi:outer membrane protein insertion porin family